MLPPQRIQASVCIASSACNHDRIKAEFAAALVSGVLGDRFAVGASMRELRSGWLILPLALVAKEKNHVKNIGRPSFPAINNGLSLPFQPERLELRFKKR